MCFPLMLKIDEDDDDDDDMANCNKRNSIECFVAMNVDLSLERILCSDKPDKILKFDIRNF